MGSKRKPRNSISRCTNNGAYRQWYTRLPAVVHEITSNGTRQKT